MAVTENEKFGEKTQKGTSVNVACFPAEIRNGNLPYRK
jgi:hypothetical protein